MLPLALLALTLNPRPLPLDGVTVERARSLAGQRLAVTFVVAKPSYTWKGRTVLGAADRDDGAERTAVLRGNRLDIDQRVRVTVAGRPRVIDHPAGFVGGVLVPGWTEIRVEEGR